MDEKKFELLLKVFVYIMINIEKIMFGVWVLKAQIVIFKNSIYLFNDLYKNNILYHREIRDIPIHDSWMDVKSLGSFRYGKQQKIHLIYITIGKTGTKR